MSNPSLNPDNMMQAAWGLKAPGSAIASTAGDIARAPVRTNTDGPFIDEITVDLARISRKMALGGTAFRQVALRLERDAQEEIALRRWEAERAALESPFAMPSPFGQPGAM